MKVKLFHYNYYSIQGSFKRDGNRIIQFYSIPYTFVYPHPFLGCSFLPHTAHISEKENGLKRSENYFMNFSCEIGFHAFLSLWDELRFVQCFPAKIHFSFISLIENVRKKLFMLHVKSQQKMKELNVCGGGSRSERVWGDWRRKNLHLPCTVGG